MDFCRNVSVSGGLPSEYQAEQALSPVCSKLGSFTDNLDDLFSGQNTEVDVSLEWLSIFVEECLSSTGNCLPAAAAAAATNPEKASAIPRPSKLHQNPSSLQKLVIPGKARSKRKRASAAKIQSPLTGRGWDQTLHMTSSSDPPLLQQAYWLADSELIVPKKEDSSSSGGGGSGRDSDEQEETTMREEKARGKDSCLEGSSGQAQPRRCSHCLAQRTPQWRAGPLGPKTLCNACGVRYKSGRLLPEYRPAKSPSFVSYKHSNSHKKVMEMRMAIMSSLPTQAQAQAQAQAQPQPQPQPQQ